MNPATLLLITQTLTALATAGAQVGALVENARKEGRDLTDEELDKLTALRKAAVDAAIAVLP